MRKQAPMIEWTIVENDTDWERQSALFLPDNEAVANRRRSLPPYFWSVVALLLLLVVAGNWGLRIAQSGARQAAAVPVVTHSGDPLANSLANFVLQTQSTIESSILLTVVEQLANRQALAEFQASMSWQDQFARHERDRDASRQTTDPGDQFDLALQEVTFQGDLAVVNIVMSTKNGAPAYRQTRFYRHTSTGWRQTAPDAALWGSERSLETHYFVFHFRQHDSPVVSAVAPQVDALYNLLRRNFGLPTMFGGEKLMIDVSITQPIGALPWFGAPTPIRVPSPALYVAPVKLTDAQLLEQAIALPLLQVVLAQASERHAVAEFWRPMLHGLYLWQVWDMDLPLAAWREEVVRWVYTDLPTSRPGQAVVLPARYPALCAAHKLWLSSPMQMNIPLMCAERDWEALLLSPWGLYDPLIQLNQLIVPLRPGEYLEEQGSLHHVPHPGDTVVLATLIAYAVTTYGRERLPALLAGLGQYESWETLLPAVYGVSAAEFEAGWQSYLAVQYQ